ncbi:MAG: hypothetical protein JO369_00680 [Paucibacter sp.]|nr:hypothetical protein [Roseateles sp.]
MSAYQLPLTLAIAIAGPLFALRYLRSILLHVITVLCPASGGAEFWWRVLNVLALCGSLLLMLVFGPGSDVHDFSELLRRSLMLVTLAVFVSVAFVTSRIWRGVERQLASAAPKPLVGPEALHIPADQR